MQQTIEGVDPRSAPHSEGVVGRIAGLLGKASVLPIMIPLWVIFALLTPAFATWTNAKSVLAVSAVVTTVAVGETLILLTGGIDLSVATVVSCSAVLAATVMGSEGDPLVGLMVAVLVGLAFGLVNGFAVAVIGVTPFVLTLGTYLVARGIAFSVSEGIAVRVPRAIRDFGKADILGVPSIALVAIAVLLVFGFLLSKTTWGRYVYLLGSNEEASRYVGIRRQSVKASVYIIAGALSGLAGFLSIANLGTAIPGVGDKILLTIIGGVILGGTSLFGGEGSMWRTALGVLLLATLTNGLNLLGFEFFDQLVAQGIVILLGTGLAVRLGRSTQGV